MTRTVTPSTWSQEDRALILAWRIYRDSLCDGCSQPRAVAWHWDMDGWYDVEVRECQACSAVDSRMSDERGGEDDHRKRYPMVHSTRDLGAKPLPPFERNRRGD